jgi:hypothetical protein
MIKTVEAAVDDQGKVRLFQPVHLGGEPSGSRRDSRPAGSYR